MKRKHWMQVPLCRYVYHELSQKHASHNFFRFKLDKRHKVVLCNIFTLIFRCNIEKLTQLVNNEPFL